MILIFSIICEELGVFGALLLLLMFGYLLYRLFVIAQNARDLYGTLVVSGVLRAYSAPGDTEYTGGSGNDAGNRNYASVYQLRGNLPVIPYDGTWRRAVRGEFNPAGRK